MTEITDKIGLKAFLVRIFVAESGISSRRVMAFGTWIALLFLMFFKYDITYVNTAALLIAGLLGLTTLTSIFAPKVKE